MAIALTATRYVDPATGLVGTKLAVTDAAAAPSTQYASDFSTGLDGWAVSAGTADLTRNTADSPVSIELHVTAMGTDADTSRTITGLTVGQSYRVQVEVKRQVGHIRVGVSGSGLAVNTGYLSTNYAAWQTVTLDFTATATSHFLNLTARSNTTWAFPDSYFRRIKVTGPTGTWKTLRIRRTSDANSAAPVWVRNPAGVDTAGGSATLYDYEPALTGTVVYDAYDGADNGVRATVTVGQPTDATWVSLPAKASNTSPYVPPNMDLFKVTDWAEGQDTIGRTHQIIGRTDKVGNPGPLALRAGTFDVLGLSYAAVKELRTLLGAGDVALLRQPTHAGLDLYFTVSDISTRYDTDAQTWTATVSYDEVPKP